MSGLANTGDVWNDVGSPLTHTTTTSNHPVRAFESVPVVSVVIPAYNCAETVIVCLGSVLGQSYPRDRFEVIVVDDGSTDRTAAMAKASAETWEGRFILVSQANAGPAAARNAGIHAASGDIVAFIDADCIAACDWLERLVHVFQQHPDVAGVGGPLHNAAQVNTLVARYLIAVEFYRHRVRKGEVEYLLTANAAFLRSALLDVGGFAERRRAWAEDADLSFRLLRSGYVLLHAPSGSVTHIGVLESIRSLASGLYRYGFGNAILAPGWPVERSAGRQFVRHAGAVVLAPLLALRLRHRVGWRVALAFCPLIAIEHIAFSAGLVSGLVSGWITTEIRWERNRIG